MALIGRLVSNRQVDLLTLELERDRPFRTAIDVGLQLSAEVLDDVRGEVSPAIHPSSSRHAEREA